MLYHILLNVINGDGKEQNWSKKSKIGKDRLKRKNQKAVREGEPPSRH